MNNTQALAMTQARATELGITTITDMAAVADQLVMAAPPELGYAGTSTQVLRIEFRRTTAYMVRIWAINDATTWSTSSWYTISDAPHSLEIDWRAATAPGANNGSVAFWIDGQPQTSVTGVDNDTRRIDRVRLGAISAIDTGTRGTHYFDDFASRRTTFIGTTAAGVGAASVAEETVNAIAATPAPPTLLATQTQPNAEQKLSSVVDGLPVEVAFLADGSPNLSAICSC